MSDAHAAGPSIHAHLGAVMPPLLLEASAGSPEEPRPRAAAEALRQICAAVAEEGIYLLIGQLDKGLEDKSRRLAAARCIKAFCETTRLDFQEHVPGLITVSPPVS